MTALPRIVRWPLAVFGLALLASFVLASGPVLAVQPTVKTVPKVPSNPLIPHDTVSGASHTLKGTADVQGANFEFTWDFGDGSPVSTGTVTNQYAIEAAHTYTGNPGDVFTATLSVRDTTTGESDSENYFVVIQADTLETRANMAIDQGLWWLHKAMFRTTASGQPAGHWEFGCSVGCNSHYVITPSNVSAFLVNGHLETGPASSPYTETVQRAMRWVFVRLRTIAIGMQTYPAPIGTVNPDANGNGLGVEVAQNDMPYQGGMFMDAIAATGTPGAVTTTGPAGIVGRTYLDIVQDMVDAYAWGQGHNGTFYGGWRYFWNYPSINSNHHSDNSTNQWAAIGILGAQAFGATVPQFVIDANINSVNRTQTLSSANTGQFGYTNSPGPVWGPYATTPSGMVQMVMDGIGRGDARWDRSENFMRNRFCNTGGPRNAIRDYYYGLFSFTKSMRLHDPDGDMTPNPLQFLRNQPGGANPLDWYNAEAAASDPCDGVARTLVNDQNPAGYWFANNFSGSQYHFETSWAIIMLNQTVFASGVPVAVAAATPNPAVAGQTINLDGSGSFHQDPSKTIVQWEWDLDDDGQFDDATGVNATVSFSTVGTFPVSLRVTDDAAQTATDDTTIIVVVSTPPLAPTANANGPYIFCPQAQPWFLDGTGSVNADQGVSEPLLPGDFIQSYNWELDGDAMFDDASGAQPDVTSFFDGTVGGLGVGNYLIQLRVTDNTATSFPSSGQPDLTDTDSAQVSVKDASDVACACVSDLIARAKTGQVTLRWSTLNGEAQTNVYRGTQAGGPYGFIGSTTNTFATYTDFTVTNGTTYYYVVRPAQLNGNDICQSNEANATPRARNRRR